MKLKRYFDAFLFWQQTHSFMLLDEAANNLIITLTDRLRKETGQSDALMYSVEKSGRVVLAALMIPPRDLMVAASPEADEQAISSLIDDLIINETALPGILAENAFAETFCTKWTEKSGDDSRLFRKERIHQLRKCRAINPAPGQMRLATGDDTDKTAGWIMDFHIEINEPMTTERAKRIAETKIANKNIFLWIDGGIVSMCASDRETQHGKSVNLVYTPPRNRGKGYATSCVHNLCQQILDEGKTFCCLYTDRENPTSNHIYSEIGFVPIFDLLHYKFKTRRNGVRD